MNENKSLRKYTSRIIRKVQSEISPLLKIEVDTKMHLAARIADIIKSKSLTKGEFAEKIGKNPSEVSKWLSGTHNFTIVTLSEIAYALNVQVSDLFIPAKPRVINQIRIVSTSKTEQSGIRFLTPMGNPYHGIHG